ncbi:MAG: CotH kinase family protein [Gemmiger sp.]|uniref:CotH kinase family protein n=1 Tax=Gemmiger sp. TaxID=2049027 RepID=UPI002E7677C2|nr:CotH kinase family protein [Gemmiger sp.]MEE0801199.1 CotH kinase family protein [Gemmiger sp.]
MKQRLLTLALAGVISASLVLPAYAEAITPDSLRAAFAAQTTAVQDAETPETGESGEPDVTEEPGLSAAGYTAQLVDGIYCLFLPVNVDLSTLEVEVTNGVTGVTGDGLTLTDGRITGDFTGQDSFTLTLADGTTAPAELYRSDLPCISIDLNGVTKDQIDAGSKDDKYKHNALTLINTDGTELNETDVEVKGRGNSTWTKPKKPYQIKLDSKADLLGMGSAKTWILLANWSDPSLMRNKLVFDWAHGMEAEGVNRGTPEGEWVDVWFDGEYAGNYLLCEKVQVGDTRIPLTQDDGVVAEIDDSYYAAEDDWFAAQHSGTHFVLKDSTADDAGEPDSLSEKAFAAFEQEINELEALIYAPEKDWQAISERIDVQSFADYYLIAEMTENWDCFISSTYMFRDGADDVIHMGPVWDFDLSMIRTYDPEIDYAMNRKDSQFPRWTWCFELLKIPEFREIVVQRYQEALRPQLEQAEQTCTAYKAQLERSAAMEVALWGTGKHDDDVAYTKDIQWNSACKELINWINARTAYLNTRYDEDLVETGFTAETLAPVSPASASVTLGAGESKTLTYKVRPAAACDAVSVTSSDERVVTAQAGPAPDTLTLTAVGGGDAEVTVTMGKVSLTYSVHVDGPAFLLEGWVTEDGKEYWYENGVKQGTEGRGKEIYDPDSDAWYWLDAVQGGAKAVSKDVYQESNGGKWVRYDADGHMVKGEQYADGGWYYFDTITGAMAKGPTILPDGRQVFYDMVTGQMLKGMRIIGGNRFLFSTQDGNRLYGPSTCFWVENDGKRYWYEDWVRQGFDPFNDEYRGKEICDPATDTWYWLDNNAQGAMAAGKDVYQESEAGPWAENADGTGKWVRYDESGRMLKGWQDGGRYYFDPIYGTMAKGTVTIDGTQYHFDEITGERR